MRNIKLTDGAATSAQNLKLKINFFPDKLFQITALKKLIQGSVIKY